MWYYIIIKRGTQEITSRRLENNLKKALDKVQTRLYNYGTKKRKEVVRKKKRKKVLDKSRQE